MYIGIDHGTTAMRFAGEDREYKISRHDAKRFVYTDLEHLCPLAEIEGIAVSYSMGDAISAITDINHVVNRGVVTREGAGEHIGGGTRVYDEIVRSGLPAIVIPGIHRGSPTDPRFKAYSHQSSPEKVGIAYEVAQDLGNDFIVSDVSSNTVTLLVSDGRIVGAFDACIFAPGTQHGALDVDAIRRIDWGQTTANEAFLHAGTKWTVPQEEREGTVALFAAMECAAMAVLNPSAEIAIAGSCAPAIAEKVSELLQREIHVYDEWCASKGLKRMAQDVFGGISSVLGIGIDMPLSGVQDRPDPE